MRTTFALLILLIAWTVGAVPSGAALTGNAAELAAEDFPRPVRFEDDRNSGLLTDVWINGAGPYSFAIDTGSGITIISKRVAAEARLSIQTARRSLVGGLSGGTITSRGETQLTKLAVGGPTNLMPSTSMAAVVDRLPGSIDGILDPVDAFKPFGFSVDFPNRTITAFDPAQYGLKGSAAPRDGALVRWVREPGSHKPFVKLSDGRLALIDTGSGFGFAFNGNQGPIREGSVRNVSDLGGGVRSQKMAPATISIGELELRNVPTDMLLGASADTPGILGRRALSPFKLTFDPVARLIAIEPVDRN
jgi:hypothetical protein